jgi:CcmD family protein
MESDGKIFVVVAVLAIILIGIFVYVFFIDRKVSNLEKEIGEKFINRQR